MKTSPAARARLGSVTIKLDEADRERVVRLAATRRRTPHDVMKEAIPGHVRIEEARQQFIAAAEASFAQYRETGLHVTLDEFSQWVDRVQQAPEAPAPTCHT